MPQNLNVDGVFIDFEGFKELAKGLDELPKKLRKKYVSKAMRPAYKIVLKDSKARVPVKTGRLKKNLKIRSLSFGRKRSRSSRGVFGVKVAMPERERLGIEAKDKGYYPAIIEYGSVKRGIKPRAYLRKAHDTNVNRVFDDFSNRLGDLIDDEADRIKRM